MLATDKLFQVDRIIRFTMSGNRYRVVGVDHVSRTVDFVPFALATWGYEDVWTESMDALTDTGIVFL